MSLSLSPPTPRVHRQPEHEPPTGIHLTPLPMKQSRAGPFRFTNEELDTQKLAQWTPEMVATTDAQCRC